MKITSPELLDKVLELIKNDASSKENSAAYGGSMDDGGARQLRQEIEIFTNGMNGVFPAHWEKYVKEARNQLDPQWAEYLRLKYKFEGRR